MANRTNFTLTCKNSTISTFAHQTYLFCSHSADIFALEEMIDEFWYKCAEKEE